MQGLDLTQYRRRTIKLNCSTDELLALRPCRVVQGAAARLKSRQRAHRREYLGAPGSAHLCQQPAALPFCDCVCTGVLRSAWRDACTAAASQSARLWRLSVHAHATLHLARLALHLPGGRNSSSSPSFKLASTKFVTAQHKQPFVVPALMWHSSLCRRRARATRQSTN